MTEPKVLNVSATEKILEEIGTLLEKTKLKNTSQVVKLAVNLLMQLMMAQEKGATIVLMYNDRPPEKVKIMI